MKKVFFAIILTCCFCSVKAQKPIAWQALNDVTWKRSYVKALDGYYDVARFGASIEALNNKEILIKGFYVPIDMEGKIFALSKSPSNMCFFCGTGGIETVMEIFVKKGHKELKRVKTDKYIEIKGILRLNRNDPYHLMYMLYDAELVRVIK
ncbi:hypothetical protein [Dysgonomonas gadei]|uniref:DUF3299 domain-containing protein n=1 Tax=Dysgonomonas gadei ATCC BAA-286 TaxID=742766 RepID=F5J3W4_9BACT|nr:hypothetical protein [Dysgonomonas gadei]EGJ99535.1 hypothetical protein HMPREF9455_04031 [Dysgonomonas gadei ATCC BAA-286]